jgi:hypothetical protein
MDLFNNSLGLEDYKKNKKLNPNKFMDSYKQNLKAKKFKIIKPKYLNNGGLP